MFSSKALLIIIPVSLIAVDASPVSRSTGKLTLSFSARINKGGTLSVIEKDRARAQPLKNPDHRGRHSKSFSVTNAGVAYTAQVGVGSPATHCM